jgi:hypothetical protein
MDLLAAGVYDLGLTAAEFSSFTPRHIDHFYKRHLAAESRRMLLTLWYANVHRDPAKHGAFTMDDFVPGASGAVTRVRAVEITDPNEVYKLRTQSIESQIARFKAFTLKDGKKMFSGTSWSEEPNG